jgi:predicted Zn-dependent protease
MYSTSRSLFLLLLSALPAACANLNVYSEADEAQLGAQAYAEETSKYRTITGTADAQMVERVGRKIAATTGKDYQWEFKLLDAPQVVNAFCLPGGKVAVYSGILPITQNEAGLGVVLGHEVAHATQRHGGKRMTRGILTEAALEAVSAGLSLGQMSSGAKDSVMAALGLGAQVGVELPYSRTQETEADEIGLRYAIRASYDPWEAPKLWERMAKLGSAGPTFLSTHPDPAGRAENLKAKIPQFLAEERPGQRPPGQH